MVNFFKRRPEAIAAGCELSEVHLDRAVGGFNPQPDPPGIQAHQTRLAPSEFGIRVRQIAG
jgi:hypothetical protein